MTEESSEILVQQEKSSSLKKPEFDGGSFTIEYLSRSDKGFEVRTRESLLRHAPGTPLPEARRIRVERDREPKKFRVGPGFKPLVGIRDVKLSGNELSFDIKPVTFPTYKAISDPYESPQSLEVSNPSATALVLMTTENDGSHKLIVQHRPPENFFYGDIPGVSAAGYLDGKLEKDRQKRGRLIPIDTKWVKGNTIREMEEEIGLGAADLVDLRITGFCRDAVRIHEEFLLFGISRLSTQEVFKRANELAASKKSETDFAKQVFVVDATHQAIETLLTEVKCPLPPTHTASFVAAGYSMVLEKEGKDAAEEWKKEIEDGVRKNYEEIDRMVAQYYEENPDVVGQRPEKKPPRNPKGYEPAYLPQEQGLPDITSELKRVEFIK